MRYRRIHRLLTAPLDFFEWCLSWFDPPRTKYKGGYQATGPMPKVMTPPRGGTGARRPKDRP